MQKSLGVSCVMCHVLISLRLMLLKDYPQKCSKNQKSKNQVNSKDRSSHLPFSNINYNERYNEISFQSSSSANASFEVLLKILKKKSFEAEKSVQIEVLIDQLRSIRNIYQPNNSRNG